MSVVIGNGTPFHVHRTIGRTARALRRAQPHFQYNAAVVEATGLFRSMGRVPRGQAFNSVYLPRPFKALRAYTR